MRSLSVHFFLMVTTLSGYCQRYQTEQTKVTFYSEALIEDITATNTKALGIVDVGSLQVAFSVPIIDFEFEKSLMKEHFNEKYMETERYPKATFQGSIRNLEIDKKESQNVTASGTLSIHGVEKDVEIPGEITFLKGDKMSIKSVLMVRLEDYDIEIPQVLWNNIAEEVEVTLEFWLKSSN